MSTLLNEVSQAFQMAGNWIPEFIEYGQVTEENILKADDDAFKMWKLAWDQTGTAAFLEAGIAAKAAFGAAVIAKSEYLQPDPENPSRMLVHLKSVEEIRAQAARQAAE